MTFHKTLSLALALSLTSSMTFAKDILTRENGTPVGDNQNSQTTGEFGPVLLQDSHLIEKLARFDRERTPERVVHARGTGAYGVFVSAGNFSDLTQAELFGKKGKKTKVFTRFSTVIHPKGSPETARDPRGFAVKFYTEQGNWDLVGNNLPIFFIRDAMKFPDMIHALKPSPITNKQDPNRVFDFFAYVPEATNMIAQVYSDLGTPANYRQMDGNGVHAFKFVNKKGKVTYVKFHWKSLQGVKNLTAKELPIVQGKDAGHATSDLYENIEKKNFPSWELTASLLEPEDLNKFDFNPLDDTKEWKTIPGIKTIKLGVMTLNEIPPNFHEHTEQVALAPSNLIPGIEPSEDRMLQGRLFSYADTQRYRIGINALSLPVNKPIVKVNSHGQDGFMSDKGENKNINYQPNSFNGDINRSNGIYAEAPKYKYSTMKIDGATQQAMVRKTLNFRQAGEFYRSLSDSDKTNLISNLAGDLGVVKNIKVREQISAYAFAADEDYGTRLAKAVNVSLATVKKIAQAVEDDPAKKK